MKKEERTVTYDRDLAIEAYRFKGLMQKFPNHFHDFYVIGFIEKGARRLTCKNKNYLLGTDDLLLFNPGDNHACEQLGEQPLDYRSLHISPETMREVVEEITGADTLPEFCEPVAYRSEHVPLLRRVHRMIMDEQTEFEKEELLFFLIGQLIREYSSNRPNIQPSPRIQAVCSYLESNYAARITLDELSSLAGVNKYTLVRSFTKERGITPYRYLETIRVNQAKKLLEQGEEPIATAIQTGFADQSHFTNFFKDFIGLTPKQYQRLFNDSENC